jgi:hypothetical protein
MTKDELRALQLLMSASMTLCAAGWSLWWSGWARRFAGEGSAATAEVLTSESDGDKVVAFRRRGGL